MGGGIVAGDGHGAVEPLECVNHVDLTVAICTRNREQSLRRTIESVTENRLSKGRVVEILIIDDGELSQEAVSVLRRLCETRGFAFAYYRKPVDERGLLKSRITALSLSRADIVLFIDDDVVLAPTYLERLLQLYSDSTIVGIGGVDSLRVQPSWKGRLFARFFLLSSGEPGRLSPSGFGYSMHLWSYENGRFDTEFLSGCNMSFRKAALARLEPVPWLQGYSLGEDVYLSFLARKHGALIVDPGLRVQHHRELTARDPSSTVSRSEIVNHYHLLRLYEAPLWRYLALVWTGVGLLTLSLLRGQNRIAAGYGSGLWFVIRQLLSRCHASIAAPKEGENCQACFKVGNRDAGSEAGIRDDQQ